MDKRHKTMMVDDGNGGYVFIGTDCGGWCYVLVDDNGDRMAFDDMNEARRYVEEFGYEVLCENVYRKDVRDALSGNTYAVNFDVTVVA